MLMSDVQITYESDNLFKRQVRLGSRERERIQSGGVPKPVIRIVLFNRRGRFRELMLTKDSL
jgi:hypothetical protein